MSPYLKVAAAPVVAIAVTLIAIGSAGLSARTADSPVLAGSPHDPLAQERRLRWPGDGTEDPNRGSAGSYLTLPKPEAIVEQLLAMVALPPTAPIAPTSVPPSVSPAVTVAIVRASGPVATPPEVSARNAVVLDEQSLTVLYDKAAHERRPPASLTKVVTAALAVQLGDLDSVVENTVDAYRMPGSSLMIIRPGEEYTLRDLVYGMMLRSGNDASLAIARHISTTDEMFVYHMNVLVERLGLQDSHFIDPHGLGGEGHYSSAYDLAVLARYGMQFPDFATVVAAPAWVAEGTRKIEMANLNPFMHLYPGADGLKTGYTEDAGLTFIGSAVRDGRRLYVVLLNSSARWSDAAALLDWAFENHTWPESSASTAPTVDAGTDIAVLREALAVEVSR